MQLLEIFISTQYYYQSPQQNHHGLCNYTQYRFHRIHDTDRKKRQSFQTAEKQLKEHLHHNQQLYQYHDDHNDDEDDSRATGGSSTDTDTDTDTPNAKIVFQIVAYQDATHLQRLVQSLWMPQHFFLVHIEKSAEPDFQQAVHKIAKRYSNVVVLQFGNVVYETDSVSQINLEIMEWLIMTLPTGESTFDYLVTLGGAAFPLWNATALSQHLYQAKHHQQGRHVWMGELLHSAQRVHHPQAMLVWNRKRLYTSSENGEKISWRLGNIVTTPVPQWMNRSMHHKSTSGNQAIYSLDVVKRIIENPHVRQLFALAKYGCCCCLEERTWIAAMDMLGLLQEAKENYGMFQLWGTPADSNAEVTATTSAPCQGGMRNSVLEINMYPHSCYRSEHANEVKGASSMMNATGVWNKIVQGKANGILFARKFHSGNDRSMQMLRKIVHELH